MKARESLLDVLYHKVVPDFFHPDAFQDDLDTIKGEMMSRENDKEPKKSRVDFLMELVLGALIVFITIASGVMIAALIMAFR